MRLSQTYYPISLKCVDLLSRMCFLIYPWCDEDLDCWLLPTFKFEPNRAGQQNDLVYHYERFKPCHCHEQTKRRCLRKVYNCPFDDCKCIQMQPYSEELSQDDYCNLLAKLCGVTPLPLALDGRSYEGHWESECVQFSSYSLSKPAPTNGKLAKQHHQAHLRGMERMSPAARAHCQKIEDNLWELYSTRHLQKHVWKTLLKLQQSSSTAWELTSINGTSQLQRQNHCFHVQSAHVTLPDIHDNLPVNHSHHLVK